MTTRIYLLNLGAMMKVGIAGLGNMGIKIMKPILEAPEVASVCGFDPDSQRRAAAAERFGISVVADYEALLCDPEVRLIFITAPNVFHAPLTISALEAGKAVLCEKPMATTLADAEEMVATAQRLGGFLQIGFELRYSQLYAWVKARIDAELIGNVVNAQCTYICSEFHGRNSWRNRAVSGGGMFGEKLCHYVDLPRWWINSPVVKVDSISAPNIVPYYEVRDNYHTTLHFANGAISHLTFMMPVAATLRHDPLQNHISTHSDDGHELRYLLYGTKGAIETDVFRRRFRRWEFTDSPAGLVSRVAEDLTWEASDFEDNRFVHNTTGQAHDVIRRVANGLPPYTDPEDSLETMRVVAAAEEQELKGDTHAHGGICSPTIAGGTSARTF